MNGNETNHDAEDDADGPQCRIGNDVMSQCCATLGSVRAWNADWEHLASKAGQPIQSDRETWLVEVAATIRERERC